MSGRPTVNARLGALVLLSISALVFCPFVGMIEIAPSVLSDPFGRGTGQRIFWELRVPRALVVFLAGAALSVGGVVFQSMFRNHLACPFTLGVSSGAAFGIALFEKLAPLSWALFPLPLSWVAGMAGSAVTIGAIVMLARRSSGFGTAEVLLSGVVINIFFGSLILFVQFLGDYGEVFRTTRWLMGGFELTGMRAFYALAPAVILPCFIVAVRSRDLDLLTMGDELALGRGLDVVAATRRFFFAVSLMIGVTVSICGPIGFVGIMIPHTVRVFLGPIHRELLPASFFFGGAFLLICDTMARSIAAPAEIPVGVITALLGGPFFMWIMLRRS